MPSRYDDELWERVPRDPGPPPSHLTRFVESLPPVARALDLGCGDGRLTGRLRSDDLTIADVSRVALDRASAALPGARPVELTPDAALPFDDTSFDLVLCAETLEHVRDVQLLLSDVRRVLRPGGTLALTTPANGRLTAARALLLGWDRVLDPLAPHLRFFCRRSLERLLHEMGFTATRVGRRRGTLLVTARR